MAGGKGSIAVAAMLGVALVGAMLVQHAHLVYSLVLALIVLVSVRVTTWRLGRSGPAWVGAEK